MKFPQFPRNRCQFLACFLISSPLLSAQVITYDIDITVDNDFAMYLGTDTGVSGSFQFVYDNTVDWPQQIANNGSNLVGVQNPGSLPYIYVIARDLGIHFNISGKLNGINIVNNFFTNNNSVRVSTLIPNAQFPNWIFDNSTPALEAATGAPYGPNPAGPTPANPSALAIHNDVLALLGSGFNFNWALPQPGRGIVIDNNPDADGTDVYDLDGDSNTTETIRHGFVLPRGGLDQRFYVYRFGTQEFGIGPIPEPSSCLMLLLGMSGLLLRRRRQS